ncbi:hypothetical protein U9M48_006284 [Paspalum notatum var. saurae]|uniref:Cystatin domain-containing protein n=1 Tax=Paspalum notatum var. saurae TaxID=547442 RepID=A0AAQ3SLQ0_PASNO
MAVKPSLHCAHAEPASNGQPVSSSATAAGVITTASFTATAGVFPASITFPASNWTPVADVNDPAIQQEAQFAVRIYALSTRQLKMSLVNVVSGETQPYDGGYNYHLVVTVSGGKKTQYDALVWGILGTTSWKLWSFTPKY